MSRSFARQTDNVAVTTDFFTSFLDDPYLLGRVAALNALGDIFATGAKPTAALATIAVPHGPSDGQEHFLHDLLAGSLQELRAASTPLVGGHTIEADQAVVGFTVLGEADPAGLIKKGGLVVGDHLVLTKPLGTGVLLAGHMRAKCRHDWMAVLLDTMLTSNESASEVAKEIGIRAMTDVTGFGLAGHLHEMLSASRASAELSLKAIPVMPGALELADEGLESTMAPGNRFAEASLRCASATEATNRYAMLFDPQTSGGLLMGVGDNLLPELLNRLDDRATVIGRVISTAEDGPVVRVLD